MAIDDGYRARLLERLPESARRVVERAHEEDFLLTAAGMAFYALISLVPFVVCIVWVVSLLVGDERIESLAETLGEMSPDGVGVDEAITNIGEMGAGAGLAVVATFVWPATSYGSALVRAMDRISRSQAERRGVLGRGLVLVVLVPVFAFGGLVAALAGAAVLRDVDGGLARLAVALPVGFTATTVMLLLIYRIFPADRPPLRKAFRPAAISAAAVSLLSVGYVAYVTMGADFTDRYATSGLAAVVMLGGWLYLFNLLLLAGYKLSID